ncbi:unnamed protein product [Ilex paraguariensis]|uniref:Prolamin-like domain-containing protein n=1 Tax=Ilex paraguariensis TaxID=185542 RepID=A0ABC8T2B1_9AQUA
MAYSSKLILTGAALLACFMASVAMARPLGTESTLLARLKLDGEESSSNCWESLFQLQSCTGEVLLFFLNGETYLGTGCCHAIRVIQHDCWPTMLGSVGFTAEEGDILRGYCDAVDSGSAPTPPTPPHAVLPNTTTFHAAVPSS